jgi:hygromycin-B 7''-O-kinase
MLPARIDEATFDALQADPAAWLPDMQALADAQGGGPLQAAGSGSVLVALLGSDRVLKLYPPFMHGHCAYEQAVLPLLAGRLAVPTPRLLAAGAHQGWPWLLMTRLAGTPMTAAWPALAEADKCALLQAIGALAAEVHALPVPDSLRPLAPAWPDFIARQRLGCAARQQRTGLPAHLLAQLEGFIQGPLPDADGGGPAVLLTGEYTPMNLLLQGPRLAGMYDFGDGLLGPRAYDWLGPLCFLAAGHPARCAAFRQGLGTDVVGVWDAGLRQRLLRLLLLHRYSCLRTQIALPQWQRAPSLEALAELLWGG